MICVISAIYDEQQSGGVCLCWHDKIRVCSQCTPISAEDVYHSVRKYKGRLLLMKRNTPEPFLLFPTEARFCLVLSYVDARFDVQYLTQLLHAVI